MTTHWSSRPASATLCTLSNVAAVAIASVTFSACMDPLTTKPKVDLAHLEVVDATIPDNSPESDHVTIARAVPGFGGFWFDRDGNGHAYLVDLRDSTRLRPYIQPKLDKNNRGYEQSRKPATRLVFEQGRYDFRELLAWKRQISHVAAGVSGFVSLGIRRSENKVVIGVEREADITQFRTILAEQQIPEAAVTIELRGRPHPLQTLRDSAHVRIGGLQIYMLPHFGECTIGINVNGGAGFLTASHCTENRGPDDPYNATATEPFQPTLASNNLIGSEADDPAWFNMTPDNCCIFFTGKRCRASDAARIDYNATFAPNSAGELKLARAGQIWTGDFSWSENFAALEVVGTISVLGEFDGWNEGVRMDKIGRSSGWTYGTIDQPCEDFLLTNGLYLLCQARVENAYAADGDSGAPVFWLYTAGKSGYTAYWAGLVAAGEYYGSDSYFLVSRNNNIHAELEHPFTIFH